MFLKLILSVTCLTSLMACSDTASTEPSAEVAARVEVKKVKPVEKSLKQLISILDQSHSIFDETRNKIENQPFKTSSVFKAIAQILKSPADFKHLRVVLNPVRIERTDGTLLAELTLLKSENQKNKWSWSFPSSEFKDYEVGIAAKILSYKINCEAVTEGKKLLELDCKNLSFNIASLEHVHLETFKFNRSADPAIVVSAFKYQNLTELKAKVSVTVPLVGIIDYFEKESAPDLIPNQMPPPILAQAERSLETTEKKIKPAERKPTLLPTFDENGMPVEPAVSEESAQTEAGPLESVESENSLEQIDPVIQPQQIELEKQAEVLSQT